MNCKDYKEIEKNFTKLKARLEEERLTKIRLGTQVTDINVLLNKCNFKISLRCLFIGSIGFLLGIIAVLAYLNL